MPNTRTHPTVVVPSLSGAAIETPVLRLADHAIGLWHAAEALGDPVLTASLRPLLVQVARILARDVMSADADETPH